ncbi:GNAT family N-acetyltransferase [Vibrio alfacsensis]|uniref:GNAT family N-acetyltransferase n=1 Tax=Vibrio TaxID=662 RepID=UPI0040693DD3
MLNPIKLPLIKRLYKAHYPAGRAKRDELIVTASVDSNILALLRMKSVDTSRLLTGMLVIPEARGTGVGKALLSYCEENIFRHGDYCFAFQHLENYYSQYGFKTISGNTLPNSLKIAFSRYVDSGKDLIPMQFMASSPSKGTVL